MKFVLSGEVGSGSSRVRRLIGTGRVGRSWALWLALVISSGAVVFSACAPGAAVGEQPLRSGNEDLFAQALAEAEGGGASATQLAVLRESAETQSVSMETAREAARDAVSCMREGGVVANYDEKKLSHGLVMPGYVAEHNGSDELQVQIDACARKEYFWINMVYQLQPSSRELVERFVNERAPELRACLERNGVDVGEARSGPELADRASRTFTDTAGAVSCLADVGIDVW